MSCKKIHTSEFSHQEKNLNKNLKESSFGLNAENKNKYVRKFKFWPVFIMSFLRTFFFSLYSLALPNYLIYEKDIIPSIIGLISSISSIAYIIGPLVGRKLTNKIGIKDTLIISTTLSFISIVISILFVIPWVLILARAIDGFVNGFFWPNAINLVSTWEKRHENSKSIDFLRIFNNSWNFGLISGFIFGYTFVQFLGSDFLVLIISAFFAFLMIPSAIALERCNNFLIINNRAVVIQDFKLRQTTHPDSANERAKCDKSSIKEKIENSLEEKSDIITQSPQNTYKLAHIPIIMAYGGIFIYASSKSIFKFTLPYFFKNHNIESSWVYFVVLLQQIMQITALNIMSRISTKKYAFFTGLSSLITISIIFLFSPNVIFIAILIIISGFSIGLMQGVTQRIVMDYTKFHNTTKYSMLNEMFMGVSFGIMPLIAGLLLEKDILYDFVFLLSALVIVGIILLQTSRKYEREYEKKNLKKKLKRKRRI